MLTTVNKGNGAYEIRRTDGNGLTAEDLRNASFDVEALPVPCEVEMGKCKYALDTFAKQGAFAMGLRAASRGIAIPGGIMNTTPGGIMNTATIYKVTGCDSSLRHIGHGIEDEVKTYFHVGYFEDRDKAEEAADSVKGRNLRGEPGKITEHAALKMVGKFFILEEVEVEE